MRVINRILSTTFVGLAAMTNVAQAQTANTPGFDANGDFHSTRVLGNRGFYQHHQWLVIDRDAQGLNCRNANGSVVVTLFYGAVVDSVVVDQDDNAVEVVGGQTWLKVRASWLDVQRRVASEPRRAYICYVRANTDYIAPVNPTSLANEV